MQKSVETLFETQFEEDVHQGLTEFPKHLSSKYFYDARGDRLFQDIMKMPEYYLTDCEFEIFEQCKEEIADQFSSALGKFSLIELGAGDGKKTKILLKHLIKNKASFKYQPIDISQNVLNQLEVSLGNKIPDLDLETRQGTYFEALEKIHSQNGVRKVILFLGSNIGNLFHPQAIEFLKSVQELMGKDDLFFVGFDQKKNPQTILDAYNDKTGITEAFNKNVLMRINREMDANFDLDAFLHWEVYDPETGTAKSYLVSKKEQSIHIEKLNLKVDFKPWETIHTEISQKYDHAIIEWLAEKSGLEIDLFFRDEKDYYRNYIFKKMKS